MNLSTKKLLFSLFAFHFLLYIFVCMCVSIGMHTPCHTSRSQRTTFRGWFFLSTRWVLLPSEPSHQLLLLNHLLNSVKTIHHTVLNLLKMLSCWAQHTDCACRLILTSMRRPSLSHFSVSSSPLPFLCYSNALSIPLSPP